MKAIVQKTLLLLFVFTSFAGFAKVLPYTAGIVRTPTSGSPQVELNTPTTTATAIITPTSSNPNWINLSKIGMLTFGVDHHYPTPFSAYTAEITVSLRRYWTLSGTPSDTTIILKVNYQPNNTDSLSFLDKHSITINGVEKLTFSIKAIKINGNNQNILPANLYLQGDVFVDRIYDFSDQTGATPYNFSLTTQGAENLDCVGPKDELKISWNAIQDAEEYQLEWIYVNDYGFSSGVPNIDFKSNATRITTTKTWYDLSLVFDKGYICFRVRAVGRSTTAPYRYLFTAWTTPDGIRAANSVVPYFQNAEAYDDTKNWQYSSTYAEEGKKKEVVSFFDGSLRNRQMVTKINSEENKTAIVGETIYDHLGRPAVQVLPSPVTTLMCSHPDAETTLRYYERFNQNSQGDAYNPNDFEQLNPPNECNPGAANVMGTEDGASRYYSSQNPKLIGNPGYVPNAEGFPFSQVEYMPDNTGRIYRQGGVGQDFQLGSGHETKYFYAHPFQEQLDRLFGSEVGNAAHYQKNMVIDPNGQVSVSYLDQEGRVIATSLAGKVPDSLLPLDKDKKEGPLKVDLLAKDGAGNSSSNITSPDGKSKVFSQTIALSSKSDVTIHYDMTIAAFENSCLPQNICFNCVYDLKIQVRDLCGILKSPVEVSNKKTGNFSLGTNNELIFQTTCESFTEDNTFTIKDLEPGTYQISKILTVNEDAIEKYIEMYVTDSLDLNTCFTSYEDYYNQEAATSNIDNCDDDFSCAQCVAELGSLLAYLQTGGTEAEYQQALDECNAPCKPISYYETMRQVLLADVMPGGQYGEYLNNQGNEQVTNFPLSVLNSGNALPKASTAHWRFPKYDVESSVQNFYFNEDGVTKSRIILANVQLNGSNQVTSSDPFVENFAPLNSKVFLDPQTNEYYTYPQYLRYVADFIEYYQVNSYWSNSLVTYHPEYPILSIFKSFTKKHDPLDTYTSESFDQELMTINTFQDAIDNGFIDAGTKKVNPFHVPSTTLPWDPASLYEVPGLQGKVSNFTQVNTIWFSMMEVAAMITRCPNELIGYMPSASCTQFGTDFGSDQVQNTQIRDAEWMTFRGLYISAKQQLQLEYAKTLSLSNTAGYYSYNDCVGNENFSAFDNNFIMISPGLPFTVDGEFWNPLQPCNIHNFLKYINKQKRFGNPVDYVDLDPMQAAYQVYLQTGQCPVASSFQLLLNQVAQQQLLENPTINMNMLTATSAVLMSAQNYEVSGPLPVLTWTQTSNSASVLEVLWQESSLPYATFRLAKNPSITPTFDWSEIIAFNNLQFTQTTGGLYEFTVDVKVNQSGTIFTRKITGNTTLKIGNCSFPEQCVLSDQGKAVEKMMKLLAAGSQLTSTSYVTVSSAPYNFLCTPNFQYTVNPTSTGVTKFKYVPSLPGFEFADGNTALTFGINSVEPTTFNLSSMNLITSISEMIPGPNNTFRLVCKDAFGNHLVTLNCDAIRTSSSGYAAVPLGNCGLGESILCQGMEYRNFDDLEALFKDVLVNQNAPFDLAFSPKWTNNLIGQLTSNPTVLHSTESSSNGRKRLSFPMLDSCKLVLTSKNPTVNFNNITSVSGMRLVEPASQSGVYYDFYLLVTYTNGSTTVNDTLFGTSCFRLNKCSDCSSDAQPRSYTPQELETITNNLMIAGILEEDHAIISYVDYKSVVDATNARLNWTEADSEYIKTIGYQEYFDKALAHSIGGYIQFATRFVDGMDNHYFLENPLNYVEKYGSGKNLMASYDRYKEAVGKYNSIRNSGSLPTIVPVGLFTFAQTIYSDDCSNYVDYLDQVRNLVPSALPVNNYPNTQAALINQSQCMDLYTDYFDAYQLFAQGQQSKETCMNYQIVMPLVPYQAFMDNHLCCSSYGIQVLTDYIASFSIPNSCPGALPMMQDCTSPTVVDMGTCRDNWYLYTTYIAAYNHSSWAMANHSELPLLYPTFKTFLQMGYCDCVVDYNNYLQTYINAQAGDSLALPQSIDQFCGQTELDFGNTPCQNQYEEYLHCVALYNEKAINVGTEYVVTLVTMESFYENNLCFCVDEYCSELNLVLDALKDFNRMPDLYTFCNDNQETPCVQAGDTLAYETFEMEFNDPCTEFYESNIGVNALINYNEQVQNFQTTLAQQYIKHCLSAFENMTLEYNECEHHFTLYYYDQAGNLIRTIPPEGVEMLDVMDLNLVTRIKEDRQNNTHQVMTNHRMATTYLYNSLNQLVAQNMPDQDAMKIFEPTASNGLVIGLNTTAIQMVDANMGYLTGYVDHSGVPLQNRGYLYKTSNGGANWTRMNNVLAADLKEVGMLSSSLGYAVANDGMLFTTNDGGFNWDLMNTYAVSAFEDFVALDVVSTKAYALSKNGRIWELDGVTINGTSFDLTLPVGLTVNEVKDFTLQGASPATGTTLYIANITNNGSTYDAVLKRVGSTTTIEASQVADLKTLGFYSNDDALAAGVDGNLSTIKGSGASTFTQTLGKSGTSGIIDQLYMLSSQIGVARIEENGTKVIRKTNNGGLSWEPLQNDYTNASLALVKQTSASKEVVIQGYNTANSQSYTKVVVMFTNGIVTETDQTPNIPQSIDLKNVTAYVDGVNITYFGIGSDNKLYRSNTFLSGADNVTYTEVDAVTFPATAKKILVLKNGSTGISVEVLATTGTLYRSSSPVLAGNYSTFDPVSGASSISAIDKLSLVTGEYVLAYAGGTLYAKLSNGTSFVSFNTTISTGTSVIENLTVHGAKVSLAGTNGGLFTSNAPITTISGTGGTPITFVDRKNHGYTDLTSIRTNGNYVIITGKNGLVASRAKSTAAQTSFVRPIGTTDDLYESARRVNGSDEFIALVGANGYFREQKVVSGAWTQQPAFYTASGVPVSTFANGKALRSIAVEGQSVYLAGDQGMVLYSSNINAAFFVTANPLTANTLNSVAFVPGYGGTKALIAGNQNEIILYNTHFGTRITGIYPSKLKDVHFENNQYGTVAGDNYFARTTTTGASSWDRIDPEFLVNISSTAYDIKKVVTKIAADGTLNCLLAIDGSIRLLAGGSDQGSANISPNISDIQFNKTNPLSGYISAGSGLWWITLTNSSSGSSFDLDYGNAGYAPEVIHAIHIFENNSVAMAGKNGMIYYRKSSDGSTSMLASVSGVDFNDIYFHDNKNGFAVGDAGAFYYLTSNGNDPVTHELTSSVAYDRELTLDPVLGNNTNYNIRVLAYSTLNKAVYGGEYMSPSDVASKKAFVRTLKQENNLYTARFFYDRLGRIAASQNSRQLAVNKFSYTLYDALGRVYEAGEKEESSSGKQFASVFGTYVGGSFVPTVIDDDKLMAWLVQDALITRKEVTRSYYDRTNPHIESGLPMDLDPDLGTQRKRIVHVTYEAVYDGQDEVYDHATHYAYDIHGNVKTILQENQLLKDVAGIDRHRFKRTDYIYDLISGNVHRVDYETGKADQWHHAYTYDADNRITDVYTSTETPVTMPASSMASVQNEPLVNPLWYKEADYSYYDHGPLARTVLSDEEVQGLDYVYTLQGWIKSVNSNTLNVYRDPGEDGKGLSPNRNVARDVFGFSLHYFEGDYAGAIGGNNSFVANQVSSDLAANSFDLYNGNISRMVTTITDPNDWKRVLPLGNAYKYDQLNRLRESRSFKNLESNTWGSGSAEMYYNAFEYDANGNITHQLRRDVEGDIIDNMTYFYEDMDGVLGSKSQNPSMKVKRNRLHYVDDTKDYDNNDINPGMSATNYAYDGEGRLVKDEQEEIDNIIWRMDGKVKKIVRTSGSSKNNVSFDYDAMGHRIAKHVYKSDDTWIRSTYYVLDAQGNTMSTYEYTVDHEHSTMAYAQTEKHIYGSSRLGMHTEKIPMYGSQNLTYSMQSVTHHIGERTYELSNHLGNVLSVISDKVIPKQDAGGGTAVGFDDKFTTAGVSLGWHFDQAGMGSPPSSGYSLTFTGGEMRVTAGVPFEHTLKTFDIPTGSNYTVSFDITYLNPAEDFFFISQDGSTNQIMQTLSTTGSYSFNGTGTAGTELIGFLFAGGMTAHIDNVKLTYTMPATQFYVADIRHSQDYSPFGVILNKRDLSLTSGSGVVPYRYGYQGSEMDNEVKDGGNSYTTEFRQLDPRLGRWLSIDPKASSWESPYVSMGNNPIMYNDILGDTITKTKAFRKQYSQAYKNFAKSEAGKEFIKDYGIGGKYEHISVVFDLQDVGEAGTGGETQTWAISKSGKDPINLGSINIEGGKELVSNKTDYYVQIRILMHPGYGKPGDTRSEIDKVKAGADILHETQHGRISTNALYSGQNIPSPYAQHTLMNTKSEYYQARIDYWWLFTPVWYQDYLNKKKETEEADKYNKEHNAHSYSPGIHNAMEYINMKDSFRYGAKLQGE